MIESVYGQNHVLLACHLGLISMFLFCFIIHIYQICNPLHTKVKLNFSIVIVCTGRNVYVWPMFDCFQQYHSNLNRRDGQLINVNNDCQKQNNCDTQLACQYNVVWSID